MRCSWVDTCMEKKTDPTKDPEFKRVLGNLLKAPPKPHSEMKVGDGKKKVSKRSGDVPENQGKEKRRPE